ncbi:MAG: tRNA glutamyl-Q(34) synthetase GluQRS, partial [Planctomycetes bacterium]|nr:tRNA glutamyl-Q(34) synthetase GluQRS [Planctomycetota bacterium]
RDLAWWGLDWDGFELLQSTRREAHRAALESLIAAGRAYPCVCTRSHIQGAPGASEGTHGEWIYPGTCRGREFTAGAEAAAWRFRLPDDSTVEFTDRLTGPQRDRVADQVGDFVIWTKADEPAYQLAVVVDDAFQGVTEVIRGQDLLASTARQSLLQDALGLPHPTWAHLGLVADDGGQRLAKRAGSLALGALRDRGVAPADIVHWAARSLGMEPRGKTAGDCIGAFQMHRVPPGGVPVPEGWD